MWPWEHLALGYVAYSLAKRALDAPPPDRTEIVILAIGTQFPDLVDKPLGWGTTILPGGVSLAHSYLVAVPLVTVGILIARSGGRVDLGVAFGVGYLLHTPADVLATYLLNGNLALGAFVWPLVPVPALEPQPLLGRTSELFASFLEVLATPSGVVYLLLEAVLIVAALATWWADHRTRRTPTVPSGIAD